ncbi:glycosyltransferase family 2 protein [Bifidobacterium avesanii]|uniref:Glycosyltransferase n=1 Tax=Bifidobacterium avesanii TaxID=1798157 RepID=A0A7K3TJB2_9BIFI|nr:glycosyltransferase family 2 protein [Bifidobacterium avesanii]KAB8287933.1 glycosyl transferase family 2 [Bifidobacterium avesanii]NEG79205.1 glycosyltransferase [Bifidobacterium avesanii]
MPLLSIIVPVYNSEKYLSICLDSLVNQTFSDFEIIIIDDGSSDKSIEICKEFSASDNRILYFRKENGGVSSARNLGIKHAKGKYITFVDADDYLDKEILEHAISDISNYDLIQWDYSIIPSNYDKQHFIFANNISKDTLFANAIYKFDQECDLGNYFRACWGKIFRTSLIVDNDILFPEDIYIGEDAIFLLNYLSYSNLVKIIPEKGYYYRYDMQSATKRYKTDLLQQSLYQLESFCQFIDSHGLCDDVYVVSSLENFEWLIFDSLINNNLKGFKAGKISIFSFFNDSFVWFRLLKNIRKRYSNVNEVYLNYKLYYRFSNLYLIILFIYIFNRLYSKFLRMKG